jgi:hypothetical protein
MELEEDSESEVQSEFTTDTTDCDTSVVSVQTIDTDQLREILQALSETDKQIQEHVDAIRVLKEKKSKLRLESISLMQRNKLEEVKVKENSDRYCLRQQIRKTNPLTRNRLPDSLAKYFIMINRDSIEDAKRRAEEIIEWITKHMVEEVTIPVLAKYKYKN